MDNNLDLNPNAIYKKEDENKKDILSINQSDLFSDKELESKELQDKIESDEKKEIINDLNFDVNSKEEETDYSLLFNETINYNKYELKEESIQGNTLNILLVIIVVSSFLISFVLYKYIKKSRK